MENRNLDFCLLIPVYNNFEGLILSLKSVFYYPNFFSVLVVDDGSGAPVTREKILLEFTPEYELIIIQHEKNMGITAALNTGLEWIEHNIRTKYIARLDCGDVCDHSRFYKQLYYLKQHPETGLIGSWCKFEDRTSSFSYHYKTPGDHEKIMKAMHLRNVFIHPTVIFKTDLLKKAGHYPFGFEHAEDYAFFWKLIKLSPSFVLGEFLLTCEINEKGISLKNRSKQLLSRIKIIWESGTNPFLVVIGIMRTACLFIIPKRLVLSFMSSIKTIRR